MVVVFGLVLGLGGAAGGVLAQSGPIDYDDASGESGTCTVSGPPGDTVIMCSDLRPGGPTGLAAHVRSSLFASIRRLSQR